MEFGEKLQNLRKNKGLTQEELAESLHVSRTAVSKWESGRGYPSIDSIKEIASYFSVTVDVLLSSEKILSLAEKENASNIRKMCNMLTGLVDIFTLMLVVLPLYPNMVGEYVYSVNLFRYTEIASFAVTAYWIVFLALLLLGALKIVLTQLNIQKGQVIVTGLSIGLSILAVLLLCGTRQVYATIVMFVFLVIKGMIYLKHIKS